MKPALRPGLLPLWRDEDTVQIGIDPRRAVFIDDVAANIEPARRLGLHGIVFAGADALRRELGALGLL